MEDSDGNRRLNISDAHQLNQVEYCETVSTSLIFALSSIPKLGQKSRNRTRAIQFSSTSLLLGYGNSHPTLHLFHVLVIPTPYFSFLKLSASSPSPISPLQIPFWWGVDSHTVTHPHS